MNPMVGNLEKLLAQGKDGALLRYTLGKAYADEEQMALAREIGFFPVIDDTLPADLPTGTKVLSAAITKQAKDGKVTLTVQRKITTVVMYRIGPLKKYTVIRVTGEGTPPTS